MEADKRPAESENARQLREALRQIRADRQQPRTPPSPPTAEPPSERIRTFSAPARHTPPPLGPRSTAPASDALLPLHTPDAGTEEDPVERLRRLIEERRKRAGSDAASRQSPPAPKGEGTKGGESNSPSRPFPDEDPAARLRRLVDERRQKLAAERGDPPPPPVEPRPAFKPKPPQPDTPPISSLASPPTGPQDLSQPESPLPPPRGASADGESPADRLRRMLEEHRRIQDAKGSSAPPRPDDPNSDESPAERLARMLEQRRRSNQIPADAAPAVGSGQNRDMNRDAGRDATPSDSALIPAGRPKPRDHLPPPEARQPSRPPSRSYDPASIWRRIEGTVMGRFLKTLGLFYIKVAGVALWSLLLVLLGWGAVFYVLDGFNILGADDWQRLRIRYQAGLTIPWQYVGTFLTLAVIWGIGAVLVWWKGRPYIWPVLLVLFQLALLPLALVLMLGAGVLMLLQRIIRVVRS